MKGKHVHMIRLTIMVFVIFFILSSCKTFIEKVADKTTGEDIIRVKLTNVDNVIKVPNSRDLVIIDVSSDEKIKLPWLMKYIRLESRNGKILVNTKSYGKSLKIYSKRNRIIKINKRKYFGIIHIRSFENEFEVINEVPMETYLLSVVPSEVPLSFHSEALKAQTIVARTYAYLFLNKYSEIREFDVDDTTGYQVYNGFDLRIGKKYIRKLEKAVRNTTGVIVTFKEEPITAYFHSNSGGKIRSGKEYFGVNSDLPYLISKEDPYSLNYPGAKWEYMLPKSNFLNLFDVSSDLSNDVFKYDKNGFVTEMVLIDTLYSSKEIRKTVGYSKIKSERFVVKIEPMKKQIYFNGIGYGHGVGMSQWGAQGMAEQGYDHKEIVEFYYPNTQLVRMIDVNKRL